MSILLIAGSPSVPSRSSRLFLLLASEGFQPPMLAPDYALRPALPALRPASAYN